MEKKYDLIGLGSCTMDLLFKVKDIMRMELTTRDMIKKKYVAIENSSKLNVQEVKSFPGGSAANITCDVAGIGLKSAYIGGIGDDSAGKMCMEDMKKHKVDISGVKIFKEDSTAHSVIIINPHYKDRSILAYKGANNKFSVKNIPIEMLKNTRSFVWTSLTSENSIGAIKKCIEITKSNGGIIFGAPSISIIKKKPEVTKELMKLVDIAGMNDEEIEDLTGIKGHLHLAMEKLFDWGVKIVNLTLGKKGQWISDGKILIKTKPPKIHIMDTTGAGDATMSGIIYGCLTNKSLHESAIIAASLSAMEIEATGVRVGLPQDYSGLKEFMDSHDFEQETVEF